MREFWDQKYAGEEYFYGVKPNQFLAKTLQDLSPGRILLPADGEGRNGVFAALQGFKVTTFDCSPVAVEKARKLARENNVSIDAQVEEMMNFPFPIDTFDVVALIFVHTEGDMRDHLHQMVQKSLRKGGHLIMEVYSKEQLNFSSGGPKKEELLFSLEELKKDFSGMNIKLLQKVEVEQDEGVGHHGTASVIQLLAEKI